MSSEELLPPDVKSKIPYALELLKIFSSVTSYGYPNNAAVYIAAQLANLNGDTVYSALMKDETDPANLKKYLKKCSGVWQFITDEILPRS